MVASQIAGNLRAHTASNTPKMMLDRTGTYLYGVALTAAWNGLLYRVTMADNTVSTVDLSLVTGNPWNLPVNTTDEHWDLGLGLSYDASGNTIVHISGNGHNENWHYAYKNVSSWPPSTTWTIPTFASCPWSALGLNTHTYSQLVRYDNNLIAFFDQEDTVADNGRDWGAFYMADGGTTWANLLGSNIEFMQTDSDVVDGNVNHPNRCYVLAVCAKVRPTGVTRLHLMGIWARQQPGDAFQKRQPFYIYSDDPIGKATTWKSITGAAVTFPLRYDNFGVANCEITSAPVWSANSSATLAIDGNEWPSLSMSDQATGTSDRVYWNGSAWVKRDMTISEQGASFMGSLIYRKGEYWHVTTAGQRLRFVSETSGMRAYLGGPCTNGARVVPEPTMACDLDRWFFLVMDGDNPVVYEFGNQLGNVKVP